MYIFSTTSIAGLNVELHVNVNTEKEKSVNTVSLEFPELLDKKGNKLSISRRAFHNAFATQEVAEPAGLWNEDTAKIQLMLVSPALVPAVDSSITFLAGLNEQLKAYDSENAPEQSGVVRPENGLASLIMTTIKGEDFEAMNFEDVMEQAKPYFEKAKTIALKKLKDNGTKSNGFVLMRKEKEESK